MHEPPERVISLSNSSSPPTVLATRITCIPLSANPLAIAAPIPREAPVTSANGLSGVLPVSYTHLTLPTKA